MRNNLKPRATPHHAEERARGTLSNELFLKLKLALNLLGENGRVHEMGRAWRDRRPRCNRTGEGVYLAAVEMAVSFLSCAEKLSLEHQFQLHRGLFIPARRDQRSSVRPCLN